MDAGEGLAGPWESLLEAAVGESYEGWGARAAAKGVSGRGGSEGGRGTWGGRGSWW